MNDKDLREVIAGDVIPLLESLAVVMPDKIDDSLLAYLKMATGESPESECALSMLSHVLRPRKPQAARKIA